MAGRGASRVRGRAAALVIAGADPTGGAGLLADIKTLETFGLAAAGVVTTVTAQTATHVRRSEPVRSALVRAQIDAVFATLSPTVVKCGLFGSTANVATVASCLARKRLPIVLDPVTTASGSGKRLAPPDLLGAIVSTLFPLAPIVTVNLEEASHFVGVAVVDEAGMRDAARSIAALGAIAVVVKGGHLEGDPVDLLFAAGRFRRFPGSRLPGEMHGTGCAFASAVAAGLGLGRPLGASVAAAGRHVRALLACAERTRDGGRLRVPPLQERKRR